MPRRRGSGRRPPRRNPRLPDRCRRQARLPFGQSAPHETHDKHAVFNPTLTSAAASEAAGLPPRPKKAGCEKSAPKAAAKKSAPKKSAKPREEKAWQKEVSRRLSGCRTLRIEGCASDPSTSLRRNHERHRLWRFIHTSNLAPLNSQGAAPGKSKTHLQPACHPCRLLNAPASPPSAPATSYSSGSSCSAAF